MLPCNSCRPTKQEETTARQRSEEVQKLQFIRTPSPGSSDEAAVAVGEGFLCEARTNQMLQKGVPSKLNEPQPSLDIKSQQLGDHHEKQGNVVLSPQTKEGFTMPVMHVAEWV